MASRHQGRHKPRHHTHANKPSHTFKNTLPPLAAENSKAAPAPTATNDAATLMAAATPDPVQTVAQTTAASV